MMLLAAAANLACCTGVRQKKTNKLRVRERLRETQAHKEYSKFLSGRFWRAVGAVGATLITLPTSTCCWLGVLWALPNLLSTEEWAPVTGAFMMIRPLTSWICSPLTDMREPAGDGARCEDAEAEGASSSIRISLYNSFTVTDRLWIRLGVLNNPKTLWNTLK